MNNPELYATSPDYCHRLFDMIETDNLIDELVKDQQATLSIFSNIPTDKEHFAYAEDKWTISQLLRHIIDCERIYAYRALRFSRFDATPLHGFDEDFYMHGLSEQRENLSDLIKEFEIVRNATISLFKPMTPKMLTFRGTANELEFSTLALGFCVIGHNKHHCKVLNERYLLQ